jgi:hypothetical protein
MSRRAFLLALLLAIGLATIARAEITQKGTLRVAFSAAMTPRSLPRHGGAPVSVSIGGRISTTDSSPPPQLRRVELQINRYGHIDPRGLPVCRLDQIQPATNRAALAACSDSLVGTGSFTASVLLPEQSPFPSLGRALAFNGHERGKQVIFAHVYGPRPIPTSYTLVFRISRSKGTFGTILSTSLPRVTGEWGYVTGITLRLHRRFTVRGRGRSYLSAGCPTPPGVFTAAFPLTRASFSFAGGRKVTSTLTRSCRARR